MSTTVLEAAPPSETAKPLSQSPLWQIQRDYFTQTGEKAWGDGPVPHYITSNPSIARSYARMALGYLRDLAAAGALDFTMPFYIVELGAGSGRFSFYLRRALDTLLARSPFRELRVVLVMTDFAESHLMHWGRRAEFAPMFAQGTLDLALFDVERDDSLWLQKANLVLSGDTKCNPMMFIANYVFDGVPQDIFQVRDGHTREYRARLHQDDAGDCQLEFQTSEIAPHHYGDPALDAVLTAIAHGPDGTVSMPTTAIRCLRRLRALSRARMLLLAGDKGYGAHPGRGTGEPVLAQHGSYSMAVNFDAIGRFVRGSGGCDWHPALAPTGLYVAAFAFGLPQAGETGLAYLQAIDQAGPDETWLLKLAASGLPADIGFDQAISYARLVDYDSMIMPDLLPALRSQLADARPDQRMALAAAITRIDDAFFPIGESYDLAFDLGVLLLRMDDYAPAEDQFRKSLARHGADGACLINLALCLHRLKRPREAQAYLGQAMQLDPGNQMGLMLQRHIQWALLIDPY